MGDDPKYGGQLLENNDKLVYDAFCKLIFTYEFARAGCSGVSVAIYGGKKMGLPPVLKHGSEYIKQKYVTRVLRAEKMICLCISEPSVGSDVRRIKTIAITDPNNSDYFIVNGEKYWITGGMTN